MSDGELARWVALSRSTDARGALTALDFSKLPFPPARAFFVNDVPPESVRGGHAHRWGSQLLVCVAGRVDVELRRGARRETRACLPDGRGLLVGEGTWSRQRYLNPGSALLVLCSHPFDPGSYVRSSIDGEPEESS